MELDLCKDIDSFALLYRLFSSSIKNNMRLSAAVFLHVSYTLHSLCFHVSTFLCCASSACWTCLLFAGSGSQL
jgi:hypothetical protein